MWFGGLAAITVCKPTSTSIRRTIQSWRRSTRAIWLFCASARAVDAELWVESETLHVQARARRRTDELELTFGHRLKEFSVMADLAQQCTSLVVGGWDVGTKTVLQHESDDSVLGAELNGDQSGSRLLRQAFGNRVEQRVHHVPLSDRETQSLADAHYRQKARRFVTGRGLADGDARLRVGTHVTLKGLGPMFEGGYYVTEVMHCFDIQNGYRTHFCVEKAGLGGN